MRLGLLTALLTLTMAAVAVGVPRDPDPYYDCPYVDFEGARFHGVLSEQGPLPPVAESRGIAQQPYCAADIPPRDAEVFAFEGVSPLLGLSLNHERVSFVRDGTLPQLPGHPLHSAIYGSRRSPMRFRERCNHRKSFRAKLLDASNMLAGVLVRKARGRKLRATVDAKTHVRGGRRIAGQPVFRRRERFRLYTEVCGPRGYRELYARKLRRR